jgi:KDO2-lipid IV(A) lauroyltransferase
LHVLPQGPAGRVVGLLAQGSYLAMPAKRRWSNSNFGHVLGLPPDDRRVRALALRAYREYGRYLVELMRLPSLPPDEVGRMVGNLDDQEAELRRIWEGAPGGGLIFSVAHIGNNEAIAAGIARRGLKISVVADDTSFPELFELLREQRAAWGFSLIPWRNLREIFGVLRRRELLGLLIDWGYRSDGIPVRLFDAWTTLPAGPATLAAKTGSRILPTAIRRAPSGLFEVEFGTPIDVASNDPSELQRATQAMADELAAAISAAPHQWYSFKPVWPADAAESADLERRGLAMQAGRPDPGPARATTRDRTGDGEHAVEEAAG